MASTPHDWRYPDPAAAASMKPLVKADGPGIWFSWRWRGCKNKNRTILLMQRRALNQTMDRTAAGNVFHS